MPLQVGYNKYRRWCYYDGYDAKHDEFYGFLWLDGNAVWDCFWSVNSHLVNPPYYLAGKAN
jgi:hypothetical protein